MCEYKLFVKLDFKAFSKRPDQEVINNHAAEGIFPPTFRPAIGTSHHEKFYELIFEREQANIH